MKQVKNELYETIWSSRRLRRPETWDTWKVMKDYLKGNQRVLEIGPGLHPRISFQGSYFVDLSINALKRLKEEGGFCQRATGASLPFKDSTFDMVCAFDVLEHIKQDENAFKEIYRILKPHGVFVFTVPLNSNHWSVYDRIVGHLRRYDPKDMDRILTSNWFHADKYTIHKNSHYLFNYKLFHTIIAILMYCLPELIIQISSSIFYFPLAAKLGKNIPIKWEQGPLKEIGSEAVSALIIAKKRL